MKCASYLIATALLGCAGEEGPVRVFAAASLREAVAAADPGARVQTDATSTLARQIREGAPADVFVAADPAWLDGLPVLERFDWLGNRLVCVVPRETGEFDPRRLKSLALAGEQVPAGRYARAALAGMGIPLPATVIYGAHVREVLGKVAEGGAEAGIVYATDAALEPRLRAAFTFPPASHPRIVCTAALLTEKGRPFFRALRGTAAREAARRLGFEVLP